MEIVKVIVVDKLPVSCSECERVRSIQDSRFMCDFDSEWLYEDPFEKRSFWCPLEQTELEEN